MAEFTINDLVVLLRECAGEDETVDLEGVDVPDTGFDALGYDSLALFNTVNRIERDHRLRLPDDLVVRAKTPRALLEEINEHLGQSA